MKLIKVIILSSIVSLVLSKAAFAAESHLDFDFNMQESEECIRPASGLSGACVKTGWPLKKEAPKPDSALPFNFSQEQFCMTNMDCNPGQSCVKKENAISGICK